MVLLDSGKDVKFAVQESRKVRGQSEFRGVKWWLISHDFLFTISISVLVLGYASFFDNSILESIH
jgi:hypothetical protein